MLCATASPEKEAKESDGNDNDGNAADLDQLEVCEGGVEYAHGNRDDGRLC